MFINYDPLCVGQQLAYYVYLVALFRCHVVILCVLRT